MALILFVHAVALKNMIVANIPLLNTQKTQRKIPYLFELRHPVPRPNFEGVLLSKIGNKNILLVLQTVIMILHPKSILNSPKNFLQNTDSI